MALVIDPAGEELRLLRRALPFRGKQLAEIGCGDGRLTRRLASLAPSRIDAFDPDPGQIRLARRALPSRLRGHVHYDVGRAEQIRKPDAVYDVVIFGWSL